MKILRIKRENEVILESDELNAYGVVIEYLEDNNIPYEVFDYLSELVNTTSGGVSTPFKTIGDIIKYIPSILDCNNNTAVIQLEINGDMKYIILDCNYEDNICEWNEVLKIVDSTLTLVEE